MADRLAREMDRWSQRTLYGADDDLVFAHPQSGRPLDRTKLTRKFKDACVEAGVRPIMICAISSRRVSPRRASRRTIQEFLGHADSKTTQIYAHYARSAHEVEMVNAAFAEEEPTAPAGDGASAGRCNHLCCGLRRWAAPERRPSSTRASTPVTEPNS
jgi:hypothetical protein